MKATINTSIQSLARCMATIIKDGYTEHFVMTKNGLQSEDSGKYYSDIEMKILSKLVFDSGNRVPSSKLYVIETSDGIKGTYVQVPGNKGI